MSLNCASENVKNRLANHYSALKRIQSYTEAERLLYLSNIILIGYALIEAAEIKGDGYIEWLENDIGLSDRRAREFKRAAKAFPITKYGGINAFDNSLLIDDLRSRGVRTFADLLEIELEPEPDEPADESETFTSFEQGQSNGLLTSKSTSITTLEELLAYCEVDLEVWEVDRHVVNVWEMGYKNAADIAEKMPLFQIKAWLKRKKDPSQERKILDDLLEQVKTWGPILATPASYSDDNDYMLEIAIPDHHVGKLGWALESGQDYDLKIAEQLFHEAVSDLVNKSRHCKIEKILFPVGSDYLHVDRGDNTTTAGTRQDVDSRFQKSFMVGRDILIHSINYLEQIAPVEVVVVQGNHDEASSFFLGALLDAFYHNTQFVTVHNSPSRRKYFRYGKCLVGYTHGHDEKHMDLPIIMATEKPEDWAETRYREWHIGHYHTNKSVVVRDLDEFKGVKVRVLSSLTAADSWHAAKGYVNNIRSAQSFLWHKDEGLVGQFNFNIKL